MLTSWHSAVVNTSARLRHFSQYDATIETTVFASGFSTLATSEFNACLSVKIPMKLALNNLHLNFNEAKTIRLNISDTKTSFFGSCFTSY